MGDARAASGHVIMSRRGTPPCVSRPVYGLRRRLNSIPGAHAFGSHLLDIHLRHLLETLNHLIRRVIIPHNASHHHIYAFANLQRNESSISASKQLLSPTVRNQPRALRSNSISQLKMPPGRAALFSMISIIMNGSASAAIFFIP